jgi:uncharacterized protein (DUF305 family)
MKNLLIPFAAVAALVLTAPAIAIAGTTHSMHGSMNATEAANMPASQAYRKAMDEMHGAMSSQEFNGDADIDFARGMIPHHQAAIDMAKTVLDYGKDPEIRKLAEAIVTAQEAEIKQLEEWLAKNAGE